ncbi:MAG: hypothetical protein HYS27_04215 [Deltaproteobacteria bacterium]|nr:hypothetical protein [Deltaproteobacteria bacterium]
MRRAERVRRPVVNDRRRLLLVLLAVVVAVGAAAAAVAWLLLGRAAAPPPSITVAPAAEEALAKVAAKDDDAPRAEKKALAEAAPPPEAGAPPPIVVERFGARRASCAGVCALEESCGFRSQAECRAASCEGDLRKLSSADFALAAAADCAAAAATPCEEACWKKGECTGHHQADRQCTKACKRLVRQLPAESYRESRCVLERPCAELPLCSERR